MLKISPFSSRVFMLFFVDNDLNISKSIDGAKKT